MNFSLIFFEGKADDGRVMDLLVEWTGIEDELEQPIFIFITY